VGIRSESLGECEYLNYSARGECLGREIRVTMRGFLSLAAASAVGVMPVAAQAWMHGGAEGGHWHGTYVGPGGGVAHAGGTTGAWHGTTGWNHPDYGWHQPVTVNRYYNGGCYNCGGWYGGYGAGGAAVGAAVGLAAGTAIGAAAASSSNANAYAAGVAAGSAYALGSTFAALPAHCAYAPIGPTPYYNCSGYWLKPAYGANGVYYTVVPTP
jgi:hypothetical protein